MLPTLVPGYLPVVRLVRKERREEREERGGRRFHVQSMF
jgi:hypothetical protein